jgi:hypothetical protein
MLSLGLIIQMEVFLKLLAAGIQIDNVRLPLANRS